MPHHAAWPARPRSSGTKPQHDHPLKPLRLILQRSTAPAHQSPQDRHLQGGVALELSSLPHGRVLVVVLGDGAGWVKMGS
jgi:hypothetical protein